MIVARSSYHYRCTEKGDLPKHTDGMNDMHHFMTHIAGILCEIVNKPDGSMARTPELLQFAKQHGLKCITIADLIRYRLRREQLVTHVSSAQVTTRYGPLTAHTFTSALDSAEHVVFVAGDVKAQGGQGVHVAVHREQVVSDVLGIAPAGTSGVPSLDSALAQVAAEGRGAVVYLRPRTEGEPSPSKEVSSLEGSRNGSAATNGNGNGSAASSSSSNGRVTRSANGLDLRAYGIAAQMLKELGVTSAEVIGSDATAAQALTSCGLPARLAGTSAPSSLSLPHLNGDSKAAAAVNGVAAHSLAGAGC
jgi:3,4-dihydroxy 2-butanone 4-phosphate synthase/GTP cyclohydrolase II